MTESVSHSLTHSLTHSLPNSPDPSTHPTHPCALVHAFTQISKEKQAEAEEIAKEIESIESKVNIHVAEERIQKVDRKGIGEEEPYSGVLRTCADAAKTTGGSSRAAPPSSSSFRSAAEKSKEDNTSVAVMSNDEV